MHPKFLEKFFQLKTKASKELEEEVAKELAVEDPDTEKAKAILQNAQHEDNTE